MLCSRQDKRDNRNWVTRPHPTPRQKQKPNLKKPNPSLNLFQAEPRPGLRGMSPPPHVGWWQLYFPYLRREKKKSHPLCFVSHSCSCQSCHMSARHQCSVTGCCVTAPGPRCLLIPSLPSSHHPMSETPLHCSFSSAAACRAVQAGPPSCIGCKCCCKMRFGDLRGAAPSWVQGQSSALGPSASSPEKPWGQPGIEQSILLSVLCWVDPAPPRVPPVGERARVLQ